MYKVMKYLVSILLFSNLAFSEEVVYKENVAILDLLNRGSFEKNEIGIITDRVNTVVANLNLFNLIERNQIDVILKEQGFQQSGCVDQSCMVEVGQILSVRKIISGTIGQIDKLYTVTLKLIDVETGKVISQVSKDIDSKKTELVKEHIPIVTRSLLVKAGLIKDESKKKKPFVSKPGFLIPTIAVVGGGIAAAIILTGDSDESGTSESEVLDMSDFPDHIIE